MFYQVSRLHCLIAFEAEEIFPRCSHHASR